MVFESLEFSGEQIITGTPDCVCDDHVRPPPIRKSLNPNR